MFIESKDDEISAANMNFSTLDHLKLRINEEGRVLQTPNLYNERKDKRKRPLLLGKWTRSRPDIHPPIFGKDDLDEPHMKRRLLILAKYPKVKQLYGYDVFSQVVTVFIVILQLIGCWISTRVPWPHMLVLAYVLGATIVGSATVLFHEATHCLIANGQLANRIWSLIANITMPFPMAQSFRRYHLEHHTWQGVKGMDPDLPLDWELPLIKGSSLAKLLWICMYPAMYVIRAAWARKRPSKWEVINWLVNLSIDWTIWRIFGLKAIYYLTISSWFALSIHPSAAHFIQEHYTFKNGQETYSYYGWMNPIFLNIGYHNEHHDFPQVRNLKVKS